MRYLSIFTSIFCLSLAFANNGEDIIESVFDICNDKETTEGLTLAKVKEDHCMSYLTSGFGIPEEDIAITFEEIDENGDGLVSKEESIKAYQTLGRKDNKDTWTMTDKRKINADQKKKILQLVRNNQGSDLKKNLNKFRRNMIRDLQKEFRVQFWCVAGYNFGITFDYRRIGFFAKRTDGAKLVCWQSC